MKTLLHYSIILLMMFIYISCEHKPTAEEIHQKEVYQKFVADSIKQHYAVERAKNDSLTLKVIELKSELEAAETRLNDAKNFQFLRSADEKEQQIKQLKEKVEILKHNLEYTQQQIR